MIFADTSAVTKNYLDEVGSGLVRQIPMLCVSSLTHVECLSSFWKKHREKKISYEDVAMLTTMLNDDWKEKSTKFTIHPITEETILLAGRFVQKYQLRAYDAVQLAQASIIKKLKNETAWFLSFDKKLNTAAQREGFIVIN